MVSELASKPQTPTALDVPLDTIGLDPRPTRQIRQLDMAHEGNLRHGKLMSSTEQRAAVVHLQALDMLLHTSAPERTDTNRISRLQRRETTSVSPNSMSPVSDPMEHGDERQEIVETCVRAIARMVRRMVRAGACEKKGACPMHGPLRRLLIESAIASKAIA